MNESLNYINMKIALINGKIEKNIEDSVDERGYMSQNIIKSLRDFVEFISFKVYILEKVKGYAEYNRENNGKAIQYIKSQVKHSILKKFHGLLEIAPSHNTYSEDGSVRLMVKYQEYLIDLKKYYYDNFEENILNNLNKFPIFNIDPSLMDYYDEIYNKIKDISYRNGGKVFGNIYYISKTKPVVYKDIIFYEITLIPATDYVNKFNRIIFYSVKKIPNNYSVKISYIKETIRSFNSDVDIKIIDNYKTFIRPTELNNLYKIFGENRRVSSKSNEYIEFMAFLTENNKTLNDIVNLSEDKFSLLEEKFNVYNTHNIMELIKLLRNIIFFNKSGSNTLNYLIYMLRNSVIKSQITTLPCPLLSNLYLNYGCNIFETMPYASSLINHNISISDLIECIDISNRKSEIFARRVKEICNSTNCIYISLKELGYSIEEAQELIKDFNSKVYFKHTERYLCLDGKNVFYNGFEESTIRILALLKEKSKKWYPNYGIMYSIFDIFKDYQFSDSLKKDICERIFLNSCVGLIYGSAGTGKTEMIKIISKIFEDKKIAFLTKTNSALNNVKNRVYENDSDLYYFSTIDKFVKNNDTFDLIVVDECSMIENSKMIKILEKSNYDALLLVGDIYQIESIEFGNWFRFAKDLLKNSVYELSENFRTTNNGLKKLWQKVRNLDIGITEKIIDEEYSEILNESIFDDRRDDEIILCLNYDGPYGINSINRYLQLKNESESIEWCTNTYKVGDPVIFNDLSRFSDILYNNLKGQIVGIRKELDSITFQVCVNREIDAASAFSAGLKIISHDDINKTTVEFKVSLKEDDDKDDDVEYIVPFVVSYATSIHKSQGLEFNSVKIVICSESEELITKNIFYTAITRAKNYLKIYWSPECQNKIVENLVESNLNKDINIIRNKIGGKL